MLYIIQKNNNFIGTANSNCFVKYVSANQLQLCNEEEAQYILSANDDKLYHADWMREEPADKVGLYDYAEVVKLSS